MSDEKKQILAEVERIAGDVAASLGLEVVEFIFRSRGGTRCLTISADAGVALAESNASHRMAHASSPYELQVSSPGIDRPIRSDDDLRRNAGRPVWMEFRDESGTVRELRGTLVAGSGFESVTIATHQGESIVARDRIVFIRQDVTVGRHHRSQS
jgi:ribosome maturation factor RimP